MIANYSKPLIIILFAFTTSISVFAQTDKYIEQTRKADSLASLGLYLQALPQYLAILEQYPTDASIQFKTGVAYLKGPQKINDALRLLQQASTKNVDNLVYFYLAQANYLNYSFDEAIEYLRRFTINGGSPKVSKQQVEQILSWCENGNFLLKFYFQPRVIEKKGIASKELIHYTPKVNRNGNFIATPSTLKTSTDIRMNHESIVFFPANPQVGDRVYFSSYGNTTSQGKDIFYTERLPDGFWSKPQNLGDAINTPFDEDFPYLSPDGTTLFFASRGHYSMGRYDIYRSVYNSEMGKWSAPENIGFPYISPHDDMLFVPDSVNKTAIFFTNRNMPADSLSVILVELDINPIRKAVTTLEPIREIAQLNPSLPKPAAQPVTKAPVVQSKTAKFSAVENDAEYTRILANGFMEQMKTDSLRSQLETLRARFDHITTADERRRLEAQVVRVEDAMLQAQQNADLAFARASQIEQEYLTGKRVPNEPKSESFAVDNPKFLYQAQFATTVFQSEELKKLANTERNADALNQQKRELIELRKSIIELESKENYDQDPNYKKLYSNYISRIKAFNTSFTSYIGLKKKLYSDCISVAMVKQGASNRPEIRTEIDKANTNFRNANSIRNNMAPESADESGFEALLLDDLGVLRLELVFARLWGLKLFEQSTLSSIIRIEQALFGASTTKPFETDKPLADTPASTSVPQSQIVRHESGKMVETINIKPEENPEFAILDKSPYGPENPVPVDEPFPAGVLYKIQLGAFSNPVNLQMFKGVTPITAERVSGGKVTKYYAGKFTKLKNAENALSQLKSIGFKDGFIVAWHNGRTVAPSRAQSLETQVSQPSNPSQVELQVQNSQANYMILLGTYKGRLPDNITQTVRALAPGKDIVRKPDGQGGFIYSIGSFRTSDEANRVKDNIVASGIGGAKVITVETDSE